jgi:hypothetical protein
MPFLHRLIAALAVVATASCGSMDLPPVQPEDLRFTVAGENDVTGLQVRGTVGTTRILPREVAFGACGLRVRLYRAPDRTGPVVWASHRSGRLCIMPLYTGPMSRIQPSSTMPRWTTHVSPSDLPADATEGTYYATASIELSVPRMESKEIPAGTLVVRR